MVLNKTPPTMKPSILANYIKALLTFKMTFFLTSRLQNHEAAFLSCCLRNSRAAFAKFSAFLFILSARSAMSAIFSPLVNGKTERECESLKTRGNYWKHRTLNGAISTYVSYLSASLSRVWDNVFLVWDKVFFTFSSFFLSSPLL
jgi:hypothetical protein